MIPYVYGCLSRYCVNRLEQQPPAAMAIYPTSHDLKVTAYYSTKTADVSNELMVLVVLMMVEQTANFARKGSATSLVQPPKPIDIERSERLAHAKPRSRLEENGPEGPTHDIVREGSKTYSASS